MGPYLDTIYDIYIYESSFNSVPNNPWSLKDKIYKYNRLFKIYKR